MIREIYLAGGCFWGIEKLFSSLEGVTHTECGYANGNPQIIATYENICRIGAEYKETVKVSFDDSIISVSKILFAFFSVIDPTTPDRQGFDKGRQYQTGIYFTDEELKSEIKPIVELEKNSVRFFAVEFKPLINFFRAEEYHQNYLEKNPHGYCHIHPERIKKIADFLKTDFVYDNSAQKILPITL